MTTLKLAIVTDIHYGRNIRSKLGTKAPQALAHFKKAANQFGPALVIDMGDRITATNLQTDKENAIEVAGFFNALDYPVHNILGNHDVKNLPRCWSKATFASPVTNYSLDQDGHHLVFLNPGHTRQDGWLSLTKNDLEWLRDDLAATDKPTIVFSHIPLDNLAESRIDDPNDDNDDVAGRFGYPKKGAAIRKIMEDSGKVVLCVSGHHHKNRYSEHAGIHYITQQSLTNKHRERYKVASYSYGLVRISDGHIDYRIRGKQPRNYRLPIRVV